MIQNLLQHITTCEHISIISLPQWFDPEARAPPAPAARNEVWPESRTQRDSAVTGAG